jgi:hypothetical protein
MKLLRSMVLLFTLAIPAVASATPLDQACSCCDHCKPGCPCCDH